MQFEYYVLNEDYHGIKPFNVFQNGTVQEESEKEVKKYLRNPSNYCCIPYDICEPTLYGFPALCETIRRTIMHEEWARCEYEILVGSLFYKDEKELKKIDCYTQCLPNIEMITREIIYQYKKQKKEVEIDAV